MTIREIMEDIKSDRKKKVILDTDAFNEIDDQFAIAACYFSNKEELLAVYAEHYSHEWFPDCALGMEKSYDEIHKVLSLCNKEHGIPVFRGSTERIDDTGSPVISDAAEHLIKTARESDEIIYVLAIGAITNVTSALMLDPSIKDKICVIWLALCDFSCVTPIDYNLEQDYKAGQLLFDSGASLIVVPANWVTYALKADIDFINELKGSNPVCDYLWELGDGAYRKCGAYSEWQRTIWDLGAPAVIDTPEHIEYDIIPCPILTDEKQFAFDEARHEIAWLTKIDRAPVMDHLWNVLKNSGNL